MRTIAYAAFVLSAASLAAFAQPLERPVAPAPNANAPIEQRETWCEHYANWYLSRLPKIGEPALETRPTQRFEVEWNSCKQDPSAYERDTVAELTRWGEPVTQTG